MFLTPDAARSRRSPDDRSRDLPTRSPDPRVAFLALAALLLIPACRGGEQGCDDPTGICGSGNLVVTVSTSGTDPDPDGYAVVLDGAASGTIGANASRTLRVTATSHTVALDDVAPNCAVQGNPSRTVSVPLDGVATVGFSVACEEIVVPVPTLVVTPPSLSFTTARGGSPESKTITVRNSGDGTMSWSAADDVAWLSLAPVSGSLGPGQSATVTVSVASAALAAGGYAATITVTAPGATGSPESVAVSLTVNPPGQRALTVTGAGDGSGTVTSDPAGITCTVAAGVAGGACAASFDEGTDVTLTATAAAGSEFGGWSGACSGAGTSPCTVAMSADREVGASFVALPDLSVEPTSLAFSAQVGTSPTPLTVTVRNVGGGTLEWSASDDRTWLSVSPGSGSLAAGQSATLTVSVAGSSLTDGDYAGTVTVVGAGESVPVGVTLRISPVPQQSLTVTGSGAGAGSVTSNPAGITCTVTAGATSGTCAAAFDEGTVVALTATPAAGSSFGGWSGACTGTGTCQVTLSEARGVEATFDLLPTLEVAPTSLTYAAEEGTDPASQTVTVKNGGGGTLNWAVTEDVAWLSAAPASGSLGAGASATVTVSVSGAGLTPEVYAGTVTVTGAGDSQDVAVEYTVTATPTQTLTVTGTGGGAGSVASNPAGIACTVTTGVTSGTCAADFDEGTPVTLTATPAAGSSFGGWSGACAGTGTCEVTLDAARSVEATFDLLPTLEVAPTSLTYAAEEGTDPASQTVTVTNGGGGTLNWAVTEDVAWLSAAPASGSLGAGASATVTVSVASAALTAGDYADTLTVSGAGDSRDVAVDLTVTAAPTPPTASFGSSCVGLSCDFTDTSTDPDGTVVAWSWNFGDGSTSTLQNPQHSYATGGPYTITLVVTDDDGLDSDPAEETVSLSTPVQAGYQLEVRVSPGASLTASQQAAVEAAVARWQEVITGDVPEATLVRASALCGGATTPALDETVDDVVIYLDFVFIDGPGGVLGSAGPCSIRFPGFLPVLGGMRFDTADLANLEAQGRLADVILHEMGHVLGYGTIWDALGLLQDPTDASPAPINDTYFDGPAAIAAFDDVSDPDYTAGPKVPVENDNTAYGTGSLNGHWREAIFGAELMSPSLNAGANPLSLVTIEAMDDIGYTVDPGAADPYSLAFTLVAGRAEEPIVIDLGDDIWRGPIEVIDAAGSTVDVLRF